MVQNTIRKTKRNKQKNSLEQEKNEDNLTNNYELTQVNYNTPMRSINENSTSTNTELKTECERLKKENLYLIKLVETNELLLNEKDKNIKQLLIENERLQYNYELITSNIVEKDTIMESLNKIHNKIALIGINPTNQSENTMYYSDALKSRNQNASIETSSIQIQDKTLSLKPKKKQDTYESLSNLKSKIDPRKLKVKINKVDTQKDGTIKIKCNNKSDIELLKKEISTKMNEEYTIEEKILRNPKIKIVGVNLEHDVSNNEIEKQFREQNNFSEDSSFKIDFVNYVKYKNTYTIFAEVNGKLLEKIRKSGSKLYFGWKSCFVYENNSLVQCKNCYRFNHSTKKCRNEKTCPICAENHDQEKCNKTNDEKKCSNCLFSNQKYKKNNSTNHMADDKIHCETYKILEKLNLSKINFFN